MLKTLRFTVNNSVRANVNSVNVGRYFKWERKKMFSAYSTDQLTSGEKTLIHCYRKLTGRAGIKCLFFGRSQFSKDRLGRSSR